LGGGGLGFRSQSPAAFCCYCDSKKGGAVEEMGLKKKGGGATLPGEKEGWGHTMTVTVGRTQMDAHRKVQKTRRTPKNEKFARGKGSEQKKQSLGEGRCLRSRDLTGGKEKAIMAGRAEKTYREG